MARDHARVHLDIWSDDDWRGLSMRAQWLYLHLLTCPSLTFAGVADWRPSRIAAHASGVTADDVCQAAAELTAWQFVLPDDGTEEVLIRSFVKWDGLMRSPNMAKALARDHASIASGPLRGVLVGTLLRLREQRPDLSGWKAVEEVLAKRALTFEEGFAALLSEPSGEPSNQPSGEPSGEPFEIRPELPSSLPPFLPGSTSSSDSRSYRHQAARR